MQMTRHLSARRPRPSALLAILIAAAVLAFPPSAAAQGTFGTLPEPISGADLEDYAERLNLSDQQMLALAEHHRDYLERFRELRDRDIERFLEGMQDLRLNFRLDQLHRFEPMIRDINRLMGRIRDVDESFFNQMRLVLTEEQQKHLHRIRLARERARYSSEITRGLDFINAGVRVDLAQIIGRLELSPESIERIDPLLNQYENRLSSAARRMWDVTTKMFIEAIKEIDALGLTEDMFENPARMMGLLEDAQRIWNEVTADMLEEGGKLSDLNRQTFNAIAVLLNEDERRAVRQRYLRQAYREAAGLGVEARREVEKALSLEDLPDRLRTSVEAMARGHEEQQLRRIEQIADLLDEYRRNLSVQRMIRQGRDRTLRQVTETREAGEQADREFIERLHETLGDPWSSLAKSAAAPPGVRERIPASVRLAQRQAATAEETPPRPGIQWPQMIAGRELSRLGDALGLPAGNDDRSRSLLNALHSSYVAEFNAVQRQHLPRILHLMTDPDDASGALNRRLTEQELDELIAKVREAMDDLRRVEAVFFDDVNAALLRGDGGEAFEQLRAARSRRLHIQATPELQQRSFGGPMVVLGNHEGSIDLRALTDELALRQETRREIESAIAAYELATSELAHERFDADVVVSLRGWQVGLMLQDRGSRRAAWQAMRAMREIVQQSQTLNRRMVEHNRDTLSALLDVVPGHEAVALYESYSRTAFPNIYDDPRSPEAILLAALELPELTDRQRGRVQDLMVEFRLSYQQFSHEMVDHYMAMSSIEWPPAGRRGGPRPGQGEPEESVNRDGHRNAIERFRFERDELNLRTERQLRAILNDEQYQRLSMRAGR